MSRSSGARRILLIDDNPAILEDYRKILAPRGPGVAGLLASEANLFRTPSPRPSTREPFELDSATLGEAGVDLARQAVGRGNPYAMAFVDMRMPSGWDGLETIERLWEVDPDVQVVICTAYSDYSWDDLLGRLGRADRFVILKKPFDSIEVRQLAESLTEKWRLSRQERSQFRDLERRLCERKMDREAILELDALLGRSAAPASRGLPARGARSARYTALEAELRRAIGARELSVHYQPLVEIASRRVVALEALVRWEHATWGSVPPVEFIPLAEQTGLILPLGELVLRLVCEQVASWQKEGVTVVRTAVNVSAIQLERQPFGDLVRSVLRETGLQPHQLALELTESALVKSIDDHAAALQRLRDEGVQIEVDDFGTGYSSLSYLRKLPVDTLKIDRSFIAHLDHSGSDEAIVSAILALASNLGLTVVAEGVETPGQLQVLGKHGCQFAQGYYFSRPLPAAECRQLLVGLSSSSLTDTLRLRRSHDG
ncbi:MAG: EAL domain-containing protein [Steroidobacteraceae bacterium]